MGRKSKRRFDCLQLNTHRAQLAHIEVLNLLNTKPDTLCLIQEPYAPQGKLVTKPVGMDVFPSGTNKVAPRAAIFAPRSLRARELPHLGNRDCAAATVSVGGSTVLLASVYLDITLPVCQTWLVDLLQYALDHGYGLLLSVDSNSHSEMFGPDTNARGRDLEDVVFRYGLTVENRGQTPTFQTTIARTCVDITLTRGLSAGCVHNWRVDCNYNASDHNSIRFGLDLSFERIPPTRPWAKADWGEFSRRLSDARVLIPRTMTQKKLDKLVVKLNGVIIEALDHACPLTPGHTRDRNNKWFTGWMDNLRIRVERHYQRQKRRPSPNNILLFKSTQATYKRECRRRRRRSWRSFMEWTPDPKSAATLLKSLHRTAQPGIVPFLKSDGTYTEPGAPTAEFLLDSHFPHASAAHFPHYVHIHQDTEEILASHKDIITPRLTREALLMLAHRKTPGPDGLKPCLLYTSPSPRDS